MKIISTDPVEEVQFYFQEKNAAEVALDEAMKRLDKFARNAVKEAFVRVFHDMDFPENLRSTSAIPYSGDNVRVDFETTDDLRLHVKSLVDKTTGIVFNGYNVGGPVAGIQLQVRVPLKTLSTVRGIEKL